MEFLTGAVVGFVIAGLIGRAKFLQVQNKLRAAHARTTDYINRYLNERDLTEGLTQELADRTR